MKKRKNKLIVFLLGLSLIILILIFYINSKIILEKKEIYTEVIVGENIGFDTNATALTFGRIKSGSTASRNMDITNDYPFPIKVELQAIGEIKNFLIFDSPVYLGTGEKKTISISTIDPEGQEEGTYSGKVIVTIKRDLQRL